jgi:hypothetical protein
MTKKSTLGGFASLAVKPAGQPTEPAAPAGPATATAGPSAPIGGRRRSRAAGPTVALSLTLPRGDWVRLQEVCIADGITLARLQIEGLSRALQARGLPGLSESPP